MPRKNRRRRSNNQNSRPNTMVEADMINPSVIESTTEVGDVRLGIANVTRQWNYGSNTAPFLFFRQVKPFYAFTHAWSATPRASDGRPDANDYDLAVDTDISDPSTAMFHMTAYSGEFSTQVWPLISDILQSSLGTRYAINRNEFVRYTAMICESYAQLLYILHVNFLTYHFDWSQLYPGTNQVPAQMYVLAEQLDCTDIGLMETWKPLFDRMEQNIMFPRVMATIRRAMTPLLVGDGHARLIVPTLHNDLHGRVASDTITYVTGLLDYVENVLTQAKAVLKTFLPFPIAAQNPWAIVTDGFMDRARLVGHWNSGMYQRDVFSDTGTDPIDENELFFISNVGGTEGSKLAIPFYTSSDQPTWDEIRQSTIFRFYSDATDDAWELMSPNRLGDFLLPETEYDKTADTVVIYDHQTNANSANNARIMRFIHSRFANAASISSTTGVPQGTPGKGMFASSIYFDAVLEMIRLEVQEKFSYGALKSASSMAAGASVREVRERVLRLFQSTS